MSENWRKKVSRTKFNGIGTIAPRKIAPVRVRIWIRVSFRVGGQFSSGAFVLEPNFTNVVVLSVFCEIFCKVLSAKYFTSSFA